MLIYISPEIDFMAVRKIPLKQRPALQFDGSSLPDHDAEDSEVSRALSTIRLVVLKDRALHDKVSKIYVANHTRYLPFIY